ncbi:histidine phosphatase family protein, partial [Nocardioides sp.]|uniref:histidine phosphatase family protein n=1 Tax=Nocardioides sp. TaxID=35761 RepID=UPI002737742D
MNQRTTQPRTETIVHLIRHGEVHNPEGILYGRRDGFHLSARGRAMAQRVADTMAERDITLLAASPLERAQETARPLAEATGLEVRSDPRIIESSNRFEGRSFASPLRTLASPSALIHLWNPFRPSWGEPYQQVQARMMAAVLDAREAAHGHEAVLVSHQLPIWMTRLSAENRSVLHNPRNRECTLCSITSF